MKQFTEQMVDDILKLKHGMVVAEPGHIAYASNKTLAKIFKVSEYKIAGLLRVRYE